MLEQINKIITASQAGAFTGKASRQSIQIHDQK